MEWITNLLEGLNVVGIVAILSATLVLITAIKKFLKVVFKWNVPEWVKTAIIWVNKLLDVLSGNLKHDKDDK